MLRWTMPRPPMRAIAMARSDSVTVSIAADNRGIFSSISLVSLAFTSTREGRTSL